MNAYLVKQKQKVIELLFANFQMALAQSKIS